MHYANIPGSFIHQLPKLGILQILDILLDSAIKYGEQTIEIHLTKTSLSISNDGTKVSNVLIRTLAPLSRFILAQKPHINCP